MVALSNEIQIKLYFKGHLNSIQLCFFKGQLSHVYVILSKNSIKNKKQKKNKNKTKTKQEDIKERHVQLGNVAGSAIIKRIVAFDQGVVAYVTESGGVDGCSTAWFLTYIPLL